MKRRLYHYVANIYSFVYHSRLQSNCDWVQTGQNYFSPLLHLKNSKLPENAARNCSPWENAAISDDVHRAKFELTLNQIVIYIRNRSLRIVILVHRKYAEYTTVWHVRKVYFNLTN